MSGDTMPVEKAALQLQEQGYCVLRRAAPRRTLEDIDQELAPRFEKTPFCDGLFSGRRTKRFHGLLKRSRTSQRLVTHSSVLSLAERVLLPHSDTLQLNLTQAIEIHGGEGPQIPHRDQDMWQGEKGRTEYLLNVMWPITSFRPENGGTLLWPGTHRQQETRHLPREEAISPSLEPGDALLFLGSTLHGAGANTTRLPRRGIIVSYCLGWLKPYENMWLTYPPEVAANYPMLLQDLIGYRLNRPNLGNYDGNCPSLLLKGNPAEHLATMDSFLPEQLRSLEQYAHLQEVR
jgi:ectoine hydroxylase-related dioxygenase (phytanoyl-CoA dioxygenase family)